MAIDNPMGTDGFEFVEYTAPDPEQLGALFEQLGFTAVAKHRSKDVILYRQGRVNFIVNREPDSFAQSFARVHGPSACAFAMRVKDAAKGPGYPEVKDGYFSLPGGPGLGVTPNEDFIKEHPMQVEGFNLFKEDWHRRQNKS